jgi:hypothetical protein
MSGVHPDSIIVVSESEVRGLVCVKELKTGLVILRDAFSLFLLRCATAKGGEIPVVSEMDSMFRLPRLAER